MTIEAKLDETNKLLGEVVKLLSTPAAAAQAATPARTRAAPAKDKPQEPTPPVADTPPDDDGNDLFNTDPPAPVAKELTQNDIRDALVAYQTATNKADTLALLKKHGAVSIGTLAKDKAPSLVDDVRTKLGDKFDEAVAKAKTDRESKK